MEKYMKMEIMTSIFKEVGAQIEEELLLSLASLILFRTTASRSGEMETRWRVSHLSYNQGIRIRIYLERTNL